MPCLFIPLYTETINRVDKEYGVSVFHFLFRFPPFWFIIIICDNNDICLIFKYMQSLFYFFKLDFNELGTKCMF